MILPSYSFIFIFLPIVIIGYYLFNSRSMYTAGKIVLLLASLLFYYSMGWKGFIVLGSSIIICYLIATYGLKASHSSIIRQSLLTIGVLVNILLLLYCKYLGYFELLLNKYAGSSLTFTALVIPVGISYFTFSQISFLVDSYRNPDEKYSLIDYAIYVSFFPKITVGPIVFAKEFIPQLNNESYKRPDYTRLSKGFVRLTLGLSKKLILADNIGPFVDLCYQNISSLGTTNALLAIVGYTLQIYFDFSGYCDIAIAICMMLGFDIIDNFDAPYRAISINDFWKRWHISLTRFFRNYLYIPLGGNRKGVIRTYINTLIIFLVSGLWHGAATTFIVWGAIHGVGIIISKIISPVTKHVPKFIRFAVTFVFINLSWVFFRSPDLNTASAIFKQLFSGNFTPVNANIIAACIPPEAQLIQWITLQYAPALTYYVACAVVILFIIAGLLLCTLGKTAREITENFTATKTRLTITVILFVWSILSLSQVTEFIYVNF